MDKAYTTYGDFKSLVEKKKREEKYFKNKMKCISLGSLTDLGK